MKAKQTFINAGYKPEEVTAAAQKLPAVPTTTPVASTPTTPIKKPEQTSQSKDLPTSTTSAIGLPKKKSKLLIIIIIISALILVGAGLLGVFWESWFGA